MLFGLSGTLYHPDELEEGVERGGVGSSEGFLQLTGSSSRTETAKQHGKNTLSTQSTLATINVVIAFHALWRV